MLQHTLRELRDKVDVMHFDALAKKYFLSTWKRPNRNPKYDAVLIDEAQDFDPSWFQCGLRLMRDPHDDEQRMLFYVALTRRKISLLPYRRNAEIYFYSY
jgi:superfamily I DNA/RNA helicase